MSKFYIPTLLLMILAELFILYGLNTDKYIPIFGKIIGSFIMIFVIIVTIYLIKTV
jgi:hypothetical protein